MSLIICSSQQDRYNENEQGNARAYSFSNYLGNAMEIPAYSEVAVQSVKYTRQGQFSIREGENDRGYIYFGQEFVLNNDGGTGGDTMNIVADLNQSFLPYQLEPGDYKTNDFCIMVKRALDKACAFHPDLQCDSVTPTLNATTKTLEGISYSLGQRTKVLSSMLSTMVPRPVLECETKQEPYLDRSVDIAKYQGFTSWHGGTTSTPSADLWDSVNHRVIGKGSLDEGKTVAMFPQSCMSWCGGSITWNIVNAKMGTSVNASDLCPNQWTVGFTRAQACGTEKVGTYPDGNDVWGRLGNWRRSLPYDATGVAPNWIVRQDDYPNFDEGVASQQWYDYRVCAEESGTDIFLKVYARCFEVESTIGNRLDDQKEEVELEYWDDAGSDMSGASAYDLGTDTQGIKTITFTCIGDEIRIGYTNNADEPKLLVLTKKEGGTEVLPPVTGTKLRLFPKCDILNEDSVVGAGGQKYLEITSFQGRPLAVDRPYGQGWYEENVLNPMFGVGFGEDADSSDCRLVNMINATGDSDAWAPVGLNADDFLDYSIMLITEFEQPENVNDEKFHPTELSDGANSIYALGFEDFTNVLELGDGVAQGNVGVKWTSAKPPTTALHSYFVSCPTLTQLSQNFGKGTPSKMLYHVPQFSNSGADVGALFFESPEKTYLRLGNSEKISLNTLDINIVDKNEQLADELEGNTIVVLHIRKEK